VGSVSALAQINQPIIGLGLFTVTNSCTATIFERPPNIYLQGERGSKLLVRKNKTISLRSGQFLLGSHYAPVSFDAGGASMQLPVGALALVSVNASHQSHITLLDSGKASGMPVRIANGSSITLKPSDDLAVTSYAAPGTARGGTAGGKSNTVRTYRTAKTTANVHMLLTRNLLLNCHTIRLQSAWPYERLDKRSQTGVAARPPASATLPVLKPISYPAITPPNSWMSPHGLVSKLSEGHYFLSSGTILARAKEPLIVDTAQGSIAIKDDAVVIISIQDKMTRIFNLIDHHRNGVVATALGKTIELSSGREAVLMDASADQVNRVVLDDGIGHKDIKIVQVDANHGLITGEFSMGDLLTEHPLLQRLRKSQEKEDRDLVKSLMKTAAAQTTMELGQ
jgi:hypothetical protein